MENEHSILKMKNRSYSLKNDFSKRRINNNNNSELLYNKAISNNFPYSDGILDVKSKKFYPNQKIFGKIPNESKKDNKKTLKSCNNLIIISDYSSKIANNMKALFIDSKGTKSNNEILNDVSGNSTLSLNSFHYELNFYRNGDEIRKSYLMKLVSKQLLGPKTKSNLKNNVIIFN